MSKVHSYLSKEDHDRLLKVCEAEGCNPYTLVKMAILDKIHNYKLKEQGTEQLGKTEKKDLPGTKQKEKAMDVAETVKEIIERKPA